MKMKKSTGGLPRVPERQNLHERKLVREKERRKKGGFLSFLLSFFPSFLSFLPYFSLYYFLTLVPRVQGVKNTFSKSKESAVCFELKCHQRLKAAAGQGRY